MTGYGLGNLAFLPSPSGGADAVCPGAPVKAVCIYLSLLCALAGVASGQVPWEFMPYRVEVQLALQTDRFSRLSEQAVHRLVTEELDRLIGGAWSYEIKTAEGKLRQSVLDGQPPATEIWPSHWSALEAPDKVILLGICSSRPRGVLARAIELDVRSQSWGSIAERWAESPRFLAQAVFEAIWAAFSPSAQIESLDLETKEAILRFRAGALVPRDPSCRWASPESIFRIFLRYNDRSGKPRRIQSIPFTYFAISELRGATVAAKLHTGLRTPLSARRRGRIEQLVIAVKPTEKPTRLLLRDQRQPDRRLAGYSIYAQGPGNKATEFLGNTDAEGSLEIRTLHNSLAILWVKHGQVPLARLPIVAGLEPEVTALIAGDEERLEAEAMILGLQDELVDLVTRRQILTARIRRHLDNREYDRARSLLEELRRLQTPDDFRRYLALNRKRLVARDPVAQKRIDQMFTKIEELIRAYLKSEAIEELAREIRQVASSG